MQLPGEIKEMLMTLEDALIDCFGEYEENNGVFTVSVGIVTGKPI